MKNVRRRIHGLYGRSVLLSVLLLAIASCGDGPTGGAPRPAPVARVHVSAPAATIAALDSVTLSAVAHDAAGAALSGRAMQWSSSNPAVVKVDASGRASGEAPGTATVTASAEGQSGSVTLTVTDPRVASMMMARDTATLQAGTTLALSATPRDRAGGALTRGVTWSTSNAAIASVDAAGVVRAMAPGSAVITAASDGASAQAAITVIPAAIAALAIIPGEGTLVVGGSVALQVEARDALGNVLAGRTVEIAVSNPAVAALEAGGVLRGTGVGTVTVTATAEGRTARANFTVNPVPVASVEVTPPAPTISEGRSADLSAIARDEQGNVLTGRAVTWSTSDPAIAAVSATGVVTGVVAGGPVTVTAMVEGRTGTAQVTVRRPAVATVHVTAPEALVLGATVQLTVVARDADGYVLTGRPITFHSSNPEVATVSTTGLVTAQDLGGTSLSVTVDGNRVAVGITVQPPNEREAPTLTGLTITPTSIDVTDGDRTVTARVTATDAGAGVRNVNGVFRHRNGWQELTAPVTATLIAGTRADGTYQLIWRFPFSYNAGDWDLEIRLSDRSGNVRTYSAAALATLGFPSTVNVVRRGDAQVPALAGVTITPASVDVSTSAKAVTIEARATDAGSGVSRVVGYFLTPNGFQATEARTSFAPVSGTRADGTFRVTLTIPADAQAGDWTLHLTVYDEASNSRFYSAANLAALGFPSTVNVVSPDADT